MRGSFTNAIVIHTGRIVTYPETEGLALAPDSRCGRLGFDAFDRHGFSEQVFVTVSLRGDDHRQGRQYSDAQTQDTRYHHNPAHQREDKESKEVLEYLPATCLHRLSEIYLPIHNQEVDKSVTDAQHDTRDNTEEHPQRNERARHDACEQSLNEDLKALADVVELGPLSRADLAQNDVAQAAHDGSIQHYAYPGAIDTKKNQAPQQNLWVEIEGSVSLMATG